MLLTDELELAMGKLKADAAERRASRAMASPGGWRSPLNRSFTEEAPTIGLRAPGFMTPKRNKMAGADADSAAETASLPGGRTGAVPRAATEGERDGGRGDAPSVVPEPMRRRKSTGNGEDEVSSSTDQAPDSPLSSHASSQAVSRYSAAYPEGAPLARLKHFDISAFSLASAPGEWWLTGQSWKISRQRNVIHENGVRQSFACDATALWGLMKVAPDAGIPFLKRPQTLIPQPVSSRLPWAGEWPRRNRLQLRPRVSET